MRISAELLEQKFKFDARMARDACIVRSAKVDASAEDDGETLDEVRSLFLLSAAFQYIANCVPSYRTRDPAFPIRHDEHVDVCDFADYVLTGRDEQLQHQVRVSLYEILAQYCHHRLGAGGDLPLVESVTEVLEHYRQFHSREMIGETSYEIQNAVSRNPHAPSVDRCVCCAARNTADLLTKVKQILDQILENPSACVFDIPDRQKTHADAA